MHIKHHLLSINFLYENALVGGGDFLNILPYMNISNPVNIKEDRYFKNANKEMVEDYMN